MPRTIPGSDQVGSGEGVEHAAAKPETRLAKQGTRKPRNTRAWAQELWYTGGTMDVLMVSAELAPYARDGNAGDVVLALSKALRQLGHDVTLALPFYPAFEASGLLLARRLTPLSLPGGGEVLLLDGQLPSGVRLVLFDAPVLFDRPGIYREAGQPYPDNAKRFGVLARAAAAFIRQRAEQGGTFDIVHLHDWPAALVPLAQRALPGPTNPMVLTVHDATNQGSFPREDLDALGLSPESIEASQITIGDRINVLGAGLATAAAVTTVSVAYAEQMQGGQIAGDLSPAIAAMGERLIGITSGIDYAVYNPATDALLKSRYDAEDPSNKGRCKTATVRQLGLELELSRPLAVVTGELDQTEIDVVTAAFDGFGRSDLSVIVAVRARRGSLDRLAAAAREVPERFGFVPDPTDADLHALVSAADFSVLPARSSPAGIEAQIAQRYGALPVAHASGGTCDVVVDCDAALETGTGFLYADTAREALLGAVSRALAAYSSGGWPRLVRRVMRRDLSWDRPSRRYLQVYRQALAAPR
jgi:starch synthase